MPEDHHRPDGVDDSKRPRPRKPSNGRVEQRRASSRERQPRAHVMVDAAAEEVEAIADPVGEAKAEHVPVEVDSTSNVGGEVADAPHQ